MLSIIGGIVGLKSNIFPLKFIEKHIFQPDFQLCQNGFQLVQCEMMLTMFNAEKCLMGYSSAPPELFAAYGAIVRKMQPQTRGLAYHAIACELDWPHREMIWELAGLQVGGKPAFKCAFES